MGSFQRAWKISIIYDGSFGGEKDIAQILILFMNRVLLAGGNIKTNILTAKDMFFYGNIISKKHGLRLYC